MKKILIVDDNQVILKTLEMKLRSEGFDVLKALDGSEAVTCVRTQHPDLILMDINFPPDVSHGGGMAWDGFRIIEWLRQTGAASQAPIIMITGENLDRVRDRVLAAGVAGVFQKPLDASALLGAIRTALNAQDSLDNVPSRDSATQI